MCITISWQLCLIQAIEDAFVPVIKLEFDGVEVSSFKNVLFIYIFIFQRWICYLLDWLLLQFPRIWIY